MTTETTKQPLIFDASILNKKAESDDHSAPNTYEELTLPTIDLGVFLCGKNGDGVVDDILREVGEACKKHGSFLVTNHGINTELVDNAQRSMDEFFKIRFEDKERANQKPGEQVGFRSSFRGEFTSNLPWKETLAVPADKTENYMVEKLGQGFQNHGSVLQDYCKAMNKLSLEILEVLGLSLGVGQSTFREFFEDNKAILGANYYPPCPKPDVTLGAGPHYDPGCLTILRQDNIAGLQVFADDKWYTVSPKPNTFVVIIGDIFMALSNKHYKSCMHRVLVNSKVARRSLAFFFFPRNDKILRPPMSLVDADHPMAIPDFTWNMLVKFQRPHRVDDQAFHVFDEWLQKNKENGISI